MSFWEARITATVVWTQHLDEKDVLMFFTLYICHTVVHEPSNISSLFFSVPVIPQTGLPGGGGVGAGKKAAKVPGFVDSTINSHG